MWLFPYQVTNAMSYDAQDEHGWTALMNAAAMQPKATSVAMVGRLAPLCPRIDIADDDGFTALHWAAAMGNVESVTTLLDNGADVDCVGKPGGETALHRAARFVHLTTIAELARRGATICYNAKGRSPFDVAAQASGSGSTPKAARKKVVRALYVRCRSLAGCVACLIAVCVRTVSLPACSSSQHCTTPLVRVQKGSCFVAA